MSATAGSLFSGGGGLDLAVEQLFPGIEIAWHAETDRHALEVYRRRWDSPNLGELSAVDWPQVPQVDVLVGGYPCQPWSTAGKRKGSDDDRDGWPWFRDAISALGPRLVLLENVRGHAVPAGAGRTVGDLSAFGYDAVWTTLRASDVGAPHRRDRWFCVAYPAGDGRPPRWAGPGQRAGCSGQLASNIGSAADTDGAGLHLLRGDPSGRRDADGRGRPWEGSWGDYEPAVRRWEAISGRYAPPPRDDQGRLNPPFVEWMMGWPEGHVAGLPRTAALRVLGNGVVPQQAVAAYSHLFAEVSS